MKPIYLDKSLGIDIRETCVALVLLGKKLRKIDILGVHWFPVSRLDGSDPKEEQIFLTECNRFLMKHNVWPEQTVVSLPRQYFTFQTFDLPAPDLKTLDSALNFEIERHFTSIQDCYFSRHAVLKAEHIYHISAVAIRKERVDTICTLLAKLNLKPSAMGFSGFANTNLLHKISENPKEVCAIVDLDPNGIETTVLKNGAIEFSRYRTLNNSDLKNAYSNPKLPPQNYDSISDELVGTVIEELQNVLSLSKNVESSESIKTVWLAGIGLLAESLAKRIEQSAGTTVHKLDSNIPPLRDVEYSSAFHITALGLALQELEELPINSNLLTSKQKPQSTRAKVKSTLILAGLCLLILGFLWGNQMMYNKETLAGLDKQLKEIKSRAGAFEKVDLEFNELERIAQTLNAVDSANPGKLPVLLELTKILPPDTWLQSIKINKNEMELRGYSNVASKLIPIIEGSPLFESTVFSGTILSEAEGEKFTIQTKLKPAIQ